MRRTIEDGWADTFHKWGWEAAKEGKKLEECPYGEGSRARPLWLDGFKSYDPADASRRRWWPGRD